MVPNGASESWVSLAWLQRAPHLTRVYDVSCISNSSSYRWTTRHSAALDYSGLDWDRIRMESNTDSTMYHILIWIRIQIRILRMQNECLEFKYAFGYLLILTINIYICLSIVLVEQNYYLCREYNYITTADNDNS